MKKEIIASQLWILFITILPIFLILFLCFLLLIFTVLLDATIFSKLSIGFKQAVIIISVILVFLPTLIAVSIYILYSLRHSTKFEKNSQGLIDVPSPSTLSSANSQKVVAESKPTLFSEEIEDETNSPLNKWSQDIFNEFCAKNEESDFDSFRKRIQLRIIKPIVYEIFSNIDKISEENRNMFFDQLKPFQGLISIIGIVQYGKEMVNQKLEEVMTNFNYLLDENRIKKDEKPSVTSTEIELIVSDLVIPGFRLQKKLNSVGNKEYVILAPLLKAEWRLKESLKRT
ncbi:MAG: hypothetical protein QG657_4110 [Acidobacteriota bacterium]|nr:hypothetical protein [Acidobacteriota bacterium]